MSILFSRENQEILYHGDNNDFLYKLAYVPEYMVEPNDLGGLIPPEPIVSSKGIKRYYVNSQEISEIFEMFEKSLKND